MKHLKKKNYVALFAAGNIIREIKSAKIVGHNFDIFCLRCRDSFVRGLQGGTYLFCKLFVVVRVMRVCPAQKERFLADFPL